MKQNSRLALVAVLVLSFSYDIALSCSLAPGSRIFELDERSPPLSGSTPAKPDIASFSLKRGFDDGDLASCSDAGILTIVLADSEKGRDIGYSFRLVTGSFHDDVLPESILAPIALGDDRFGFYFVWLDSRKPISVEIEMRSVSKTGVESEPVLLQVEDQ